jgi:predicted RNA-binding protein YlxR (DUF448 family)
MDASAAQAGSGKRRRKGPRPKHVPQRMCIACRERSAKRGLFRIVRTPEGTVEVDPTGKKNGRGAYLCDQRSCWERSLTSKILANALKTDIDADTVTMLREFAATLPESGSVAEEPAQEGCEA